MTLTRSQATALAAVASLAMVAWGFSQWREGTRRAQWYALDGTEPAEFLALEGSAPEALVHVHRAELLSEDLFPPDHERAILECRAALVADPMFSRAWLTLAREQIVVGRPELAQAALEASDRFSPRYPRERIESLALLKLVGEDEKCLEVARRIGALGTAETTEVATALLELGFTPEAVLDTLRFDDLGTIGRLVLMRTFHRDAPGSAGLLIDRLPAEDLEYPELRRYIAPFLMKPLDARMLGELWNLSEPSLRLVGGMVLVENAELDQPPFATGFPMGWLPLDESEAGVAWEPGSTFGGGDGTGRIRFTLPRYVRRELEWPCYRLLADAGPEFEVRLHLVPEMARSADIALAGKMSPDLNLDKVERRTIGETPFALGLRVPARTEPALVTLALRWKPLTDPVAARADGIFVERLEIVLPEGTTDALPAGASSPVEVQLAPEPTDELPTFELREVAP